MSIDKETVLRTATLSRLKIEDNEIDSFTKDMEKIVGFVDQINELDTENIAPTANILNLKNAFREDIVVKSPVTTKELMELAPDSEDNFIKVPRVIE